MANANYIWMESEFEKALFLKIKKDEKLSELEKDKLVRRWNNTKEFLIPNVLEEIKASEPDLSDHGPRHIENVLNNAYHLLHQDTPEAINGRTTNAFDDLSTYEAYVLGFSIMYHDVGNIFGRVKHNLKVSEIFTESFTKYDLDQDLRDLVNDIASSHTGPKDSNGKQIDTLSTVDLRGLWNNKTIRCQQLAAILRFADELAEGPQRASIRISGHLPFNDENRIAEGSVIFHQYAKCLSIQIDRSGNRIVITFRIDIAEFDESEQETKVIKLLNTLWSRIDTLNQERKYARHYTDKLEPFKSIAVQVQVYNRGEKLLAKHHTLNDLVIPQKIQPGTQAQFHEDFDSIKIWSEVQTHIKKV